MAEELSAEQKTQIAGFWRRLAALLIDGLILGVPTLLLGLAFFEWAVSLGQSGRLIGFVVALLYFGLLNSHLGGGQTLGKRWLGIQVRARSGQPLSPQRSIVRFLVLGVPYFLNGYSFDVYADPTGVKDFFFISITAFLVFGGLGAIVYLFVFNRTTRQSLHDLAVDSFVVRNSSDAVPLRLSIPRIHLVVVGCWLAMTLVAPGVLTWFLRDSGLAASLKPLTKLKTKIESQHHVRRVMVTIGSTTVTSIREGTATTTFLQVNVEAGDINRNLDLITTDIATTVLEDHPDLLGKQGLIVNVRRGFDLGIAHWNIGHQEALSARAWRQKLLRAHMKNKI